MFYDNYEEWKADQERKHRKAYERLKAKIEKQLDEQGRVPSMRSLMDRDDNESPSQNNDDEF